VSDDRYVIHEKRASNFVCGAVLFCPEDHLGSHGSTFELFHVSDEDAGDGGAGYVC